MPRLDLRWFIVYGLLLMVFGYLFSPISHVALAAPTACNNLTPVGISVDQDSVPTDKSVNLTINWSNMDAASLKQYTDSNVRIEPIILAIDKNTGAEAGQVVFKSVSIVPGDGNQTVNLNGFVVNSSDLPLQAVIYLTAIDRNCRVDKAAVQFQLIAGSTSTAPNPPSTTNSSAGSTCSFDPPIPDSLPPGAVINVGFIGAPNRAYTLRHSEGGTILANKKTDTNGKGSFNSFIVRGNDGDNINLLVTDSLSFSTSGDTRNSCTKSIKLDSNATFNGRVATALERCTGANCSNSSGNPVVDSKGNRFCSNENAIHTAIGCIDTQPKQLINSIMKLLAGAAGGIALLLMIFGALQMMTSGGNAEQVKKGQEQFTSAIIGLLFVIFSVLLLQIIGADILNIPGFGR